MCGRRRQRRSTGRSRKSLDGGQGPADDEGLALGAGDGAANASWGEPIAASVSTTRAARPVTAAVVVDSAGASGRPIAWGKVIGSRRPLSQLRLTTSVQVTTRRQLVDRRQQRTGRAPLGARPVLVEPGGIFLALTYGFSTTVNVMVPVNRPDSVEVGAVIVSVPPDRVRGPGRDQPWQPCAG